VHCERATDVKPVGGANYAFITEFENFAAREDIQPTFLGAAYLRISLPKGPFIFVWIGVGDVVIEKNTSILHFPKEQQPLPGLNAQFHAQAVQVIKILCAGESNSRRSFDTATIFPTDAKP